MGKGGGQERFHVVLCSLVVVGGGVAWLLTNESKMTINELKITNTQLYSETRSMTPVTVSSWLRVRAKMIRHLRLCKKMHLRLWAQHCETNHTHGNSLDYIVQYMKCDTSASRRLLVLVGQPGTTRLLEVQNTPPGPVVEMMNIHISSSRS